MPEAPSVQPAPHQRPPEPAERAKPGFKEAVDRAQADVGGKKTEEAKPVFILPEEGDAGTKVLKPDQAQVKPEQPKPDQAGVKPISPDQAGEKPVSPDLKPDQATIKPVPIEVKPTPVTPDQTGKPSTALREGKEPIPGLVRDQKSTEPSASALLQPVAPPMVPIDASGTQQAAPTAAMSPAQKVLMEAVHRGVVEAITVVQQGAVTTTEVRVQIPPVAIVVTQLSDGSMGATVSATKAEAAAVVAVLATQQSQSGLQQQLGQRFNVQSAVLNADGTVRINVGRKEEATA